MTVRPLPNLTIEAEDKVNCLADEVLARWDSSIRAADTSDDETTISMLDVIGGGFFSEGVTARRIGGALRAIGERPITVNINSPGGDYHEGVAIFNLLRAHKEHVTVNILGLAASAASVIAMAGDEILIGEAASLMIHNTHTIVMGGADELEQRAKAMRGFDKAMAQMYADRAEVDVTVTAAWMDDETYFVGDEAVKAGLVNGIMPKPPSKGERSSATALRRVDQALALQGFSRKDRRSMLAEITGTPGAADSAVTPSADSKALGDALASLKHTIMITKG